MTLLVLAAIGGSAHADCPASCVAGGGPATTDCFVAWSGIAGTSVTCTDGDPSCDVDGTVDGVCTLGLQGCINVSGLGTCSSSGLDGPPTVKPSSSTTAQQLALALGALDPAASACTPPGVALPLKLSLAGIKPGKARLTVTASSGGKRDRDKLKLACLPAAAAPSFANAVQPIFDQRCAYSGCHDTTSGPLSGGLVMIAGVSHGNLVGVRATLGKQPRVQPGSLRGSQLARRVLGMGIPPGGTQMPQGCPGFPPLNGCLTEQEKFTILAWIKGGAAN